ncbi:putative ribonuclease H-like domain-containing protein [Tanacetum coccineum]
MNELCDLKGIKREFSVARTPQQNGVAKRKNMTLIKAARTMLADSLPPTIFWAEAVNTACYVEEGFLVGYSVNCKAFKVFNTETRKVKENLHVNFLENKPNVAGQGPNWLFDIDYLSNFMNYQPITTGNQTKKNVGQQETNGDTGLKKNVDAGHTEEENVSSQQYIVFPLWSSISSSYKSSDDKVGDATTNDAAEKESTKQSDAVRKEFEAQCNSQLLQEKGVNTASASRTFSPTGPSSGPSFDPLMPKLEDTTKIQSIGIFGNAYDDDDLETHNYPNADETVGAEADFNNMEPFTVVSPIPTTRIHTIHPKA